MSRSWYIMCDFRISHPFFMFSIFGTQNPQMLKIWNISQQKIFVVVPLFYAITKTLLNSWKSLSRQKLAKHLQQYYNRWQIKILSTKQRANSSSAHLSSFCIVVFRECRIMFSVSQCKRDAKWQMAKKLRLCASLHWMKDGGSVTWRQTKTFAPDFQKCPIKSVWNKHMYFLCQIVPSWSLGSLKAEVT